MKRILSILSITAVMAACNTNPNAGTSQTNGINTQDTVGLAEFQAWKNYNEQMKMNEANMQSNMAMPATQAVRTYTPVRRTSSSPYRYASSRSSSRNYQGGSMTSESGHTAKTVRRRGWSKAAKGAVIGAGSGAILGAVINKRNRAVGAVIGGVLGGGGGYAIGRGMDKRDGRY